MGVECLLRPSGVGGLGGVVVAVHLRLVGEQDDHHPQV